MTVVTRRQFLGLLAATTGATALSACTKPQPQPTPTPSPYPAGEIGIRVPNAPSNLTIGLIASLTSAAAEGSEWLGGIGGARVAAQRLHGGGVEVKLQAENDNGDWAGLESALRKLGEAGAAAVVVATSGTHVDGIADAAARLQLPVLMPHASTQSPSNGWCWMTGPSAGSFGSVLQAALSARRLSRTLLIDVGGGLPGGVASVGTITPAADAKAKQIGDLVAPFLKDEANRPDSLLISGNADAMASALAAVQGASLGLPVFLTAQAQVPNFATLLTRAGGSTSGDLTTVGADIGDDVAMRNDPDGTAMASFLLANRVAAGDSKVRDFFNNADYSTIAPGASPLVHDAVVAAVAAAAQAKSSKPVDVAHALATLHLSHTQGLAGPALDFTRPDTFDVSRVVPLAASTQDLGLRPRGQDQPMMWFKAPSA